MSRVARQPSEEREWASCLHAGVGAGGGAGRGQAVPVACDRARALGHDGFCEYGRKDLGHADDPYGSRMNHRRRLVLAGFASAILQPPLVRAQSSPTVPRIAVAVWGSQELDSNRVVALLAGL